VCKVVYKNAGLSCYRVCMDNGRLFVGSTSVLGGGLSTGAGSVLGLGSVIVKAPYAWAAQACRATSLSLPTAIVHVKLIQPRDRNYSVGGRHA